MALSLDGALMQVLLVSEISFALVDSLKRGKQDAPATSHMRHRGAEETDKLFETNFGTILGPYSDGS